MTMKTSLSKWADFDSSKQKASVQWPYWTEVILFYLDEYIPEVREILLDDLPYELEIHALIVMDDPVAEPIQ